MSFTSDYLKKKQQLQSNPLQQGAPRFTLPTTSSGVTQKASTVKPAATNTAAGSSTSTQSKIGLNNLVSGVSDRLQEIKKSTGTTSAQTLPTTNQKSGSVLDDINWGLGYGSERVLGGLVLKPLEAISDTIGSAGSKALEYITSFGYSRPNDVSEFWRKQAENYLSTSPTEDYKRSIEKRYKPTDAQRKLGDFEETVASILPSLAASYLTGGGSAAAQLGSSGASLLPTGSNLGRTLMGVQAAGGGAQQAYQEGATVGEALTFGAASGALETATEALVGGVPGLGKGAASELISKVVSNPLVRRSIDVVGEGGEEAISTIVTPYLKRAIYDTSAENASLDEIAESAVMGMAAAGVLQAGLSLPTSFSNRIDTTRQANANLNNPEFVQRTTSEAIQNVNRNLNRKPFTLPSVQAQDAVNTQPAPSVQTQPETTVQRRQGVQVPIETRTWQDAGNRKVNAFQYDHPELRPYYAEAARALKYDLTSSVKGERMPIYDASSGTRDIIGYTGTKRSVTDPIAQALDNGNLSYAQIDKAIDDLIADNGQENYAAAKKLELVLDDMLTNGYTDSDGYNVPPNQAYLEARERANNGGTEYSMSEDEWNSLMSQEPADDGFLLPMVNGPESSVGGGSVGAMRSNYDYRQNTSRVSSNTFSKMYQDVLNDIEQSGGEISGLTYDVVTERQSMDNAQQRLFVDLEGEINDLPNLEEWGGEDLDTAMGIMDQYMAEAMESGNYDKVNEWAKLIRSKGTKAGQMIQAFAKYSRTPQGVMVDAVNTLDNSKLSSERKAEVLNNVQDQVASFYSIPEGDTQAMIDLIKQNSAIRRTGSFFRNQTSKALNAALESDSYDHLRDVALAQIDNIAKDYKPRTIGEKIRSVRSMFMLSNLATVLRNIGGNQVFDPIDSFAGNTSVVPLDAFLSKFTGTRSVAAENPFSAAKWRGAMENASKAYIETALDVSTDGVQNRYDQTSNRTFKMTGSPLERFLSTWSKYQGYSLNVTDEFAKGGVQTETQRGIQRLKDRGLIADDTLDTRGEEQAKYRTFQDDTRLSRAMLEARDALNNIGTSGFGAGDLLMPFARVPANLVTRAVEYSPLGLANGTVELVGVLQKAHNGTLTAAEQAKAVSDIGRGMTGTGLIAGFGALAAAGLIRVAGGGEGEEDKTALETSEGISGTQLNLSGALRWIAGEENALEWRDGDQLMSIGFLEPLNAQMTTGALLAQDLDGTEGLGEKVGASLKASLDGTLQSLLDLPAMSSLQDLANGYSYSPAETTGGKVADALTSFGASQVSSFVPNIIRSTAKATDPYVRDAYSSGTTLGETIDNIKMSIPGLRQTLPIKQTPFGQDRVYGENRVMNALNAVLLPGAITEYRTSDAAQELYSLPSVEDTPVYPRRNAPNSISYEKTDYALSSEQKTQYQKVYGQAYQNTIEALMQSGVYEKASGENKTRMVNMAREYAGELAKQDFLKGQNVSYTPEGWIGGAIKNGIDPEKYLVYAFTADADNNDSVTQSESASALLPMKNLTTTEKGKVWQSQNSSWSKKKNPFTGALASAGIDASTATSILNKYSEVYNMDIKPGEQAAELSKFLDGLDLTTDQRAVVDDTYKFYTMFPATIKAYSIETMSSAAQSKWPRVQAWGMPEEDYLKYYPMISSGKKAECIQKLVDAGMTQNDANTFWKLVKNK